MSQTGPDRADTWTADAIVIGGGGAGLAAAVAAAARGSKTLLLEKYETLGGTTAMSVGSFSAAGTRMQRRVGIADCAEAFFEDMHAFGPDLVPRDNIALRHLLATEAGPTLHWLEDLGVVFAGPFPEPPNRVARMHSVIPGSRMYIRKLEEAARREGVSVQCNAAVEDLLLDQAGRVVGVAYRRDGLARRAFARRAVVLASGDFSGSDELKKQYLAPAAVTAIPIRPRSTGDGHKIAGRVGAAFCNMDLCLGPYLRFPRAPQDGWTERLPSWSLLARIGAAYIKRAPAPLLRLLVKSLLLAHMAPSDQLFKNGAVLIDLNGNIVDTTAAAANLALAPKSTGYVVLDSAIAKRFTRYPNYVSTAPGIAYAYFQDYVAGRPDIMHTAKSVDALAQIIAVPAERLRLAIGHLHADALIAMGPVSAMVNVTEGGLAVDCNCRVLRPDGRPIEGLFAAGGIGSGGMWLKGHGTHLAWAFTSGRIAGERAAHQVPVDRNASDVLAAGGTSATRDVGASKAEKV